jgi:putative transposase
VLLRLAYLAVTNAFAMLRLLPMSDRDKEVEILALRHQITVLERQLGNDRPRFDPSDRAFLAALLHRLPREVLRRLRLLMRPDTVLRWHRDLLARRHAARSRPRPGPAADRALNSCPGAAAGEGESRLGISPPARRTARAWNQGGRVHRVEDLARGRDRSGARARLQHVGRLPALAGRCPAGLRLLRDRHPDRSAVVRARGDRARQPPGPGPGRDRAPDRHVGDASGEEPRHGLEDVGCRAKYTIRDRDSKFPALFDSVLKDAGVEVVLSGIRMPRMNAIMERWVQTCRRELLDRTLIWNQRHLLHALQEYERFYNEHRPHQGIANARLLHPLPAPIADPEQIARLNIQRRDHLGGILHEYEHAA